MEEEFIYEIKERCEQSEIGLSAIKLIHEKIKNWFLNLRGKNKEEKALEEGR